MIHQNKPIPWPKNKETREMQRLVLSMQENKRNLPSAKGGGELGAMTHHLDLETTPERVIGAASTDHQRSA
jgi:hypothetical protein